MRVWVTWAVGGVVRVKEGCVYAHVHMVNIIVRVCMKVCDWCWCEFHVIVCYFIGGWNVFHSLMWRFFIGSCSWVWLKLISQTIDWFTIAICNMLVKFWVWGDEPRCHKLWNLVNLRGELIDYVNDLSVFGMIKVGRNVVWNNAECVGCSEENCGLWNKFRI